MKRFLPILLVVLSVPILASSCNKQSPTSPTGNQSPATSVISVSGALQFGDVAIGQSLDRQVTIANSGSGPLTISSISMVGGTGSKDVTASWTSGTIQPNASQTVTVRFAPTLAQYYSGVFTVNGDQTAGNNAVNFSGTGINTAPLWEGWGTGPDVFDMPASVSRVRITAQYAGSCENFVVKVGGRLVVNVILGTCSVADSVNYDGTHLVTGGGVVEVLYASGVNWRLTEVR